MCKFHEIKISGDKKSSKAIVDSICAAVDEKVGPLHGSDYVFKIADWQTGDFVHIYAGMIAGVQTAGRKIVVVVLRAGAKFGLEGDFKFCVEGCDKDQQSRIHLLITEQLDRQKLVTVLSDGKPGYHHQGPVEVFDPFLATFCAENLMQRMVPGQPLCSVWADLVRGNRDSAALWFSDFQEASKEIDIEGKLAGCKRLICVWGRTSGKRAKTEGHQTGTGGANPQFDSSKKGNYQLCSSLLNRNVAKVAIVGKGGFNAETQQLPGIINLGEFWLKFKKVRGRFQENGYFDFLSAIYGINIVHVGMKSGGMDALGVWGQKVVFIDDESAHEFPKGRVDAWAGPNLVPFRVTQLPTLTGQAIVRDGTMRTTLKPGDWEKVDDSKSGMSQDTRKELRGFDRRELKWLCDQVVLLLDRT